MGGVVDPTDRVGTMLTMLLEKLLTMEQMLGKRDFLAIRELLLEAETQVIELDRERIDLLEELTKLRESCFPVAPSELCRMCPFCRTGVRAWAMPAEA